MTDFFTKLEIGKNVSLRELTTLSLNKSNLSFGAFGQKYEGDFLNDQITGKGVLTYKNGTKYEGEFFEVLICFKC